MTGETLSPWMRDPDAPRAWMRIVKGGDPAAGADRRVYVGQTPRVYDPRSGLAPNEPYYLVLAGPGGADRWETRDEKPLRVPGWIAGPRGSDDEGDGPDPISRAWADDKARELGYVLEGP